MTNFYELSQCNGHDRSELAQIDTDAFVHIFFRSNVI